MKKVLLFAIVFGLILMGAIRVELAAKEPGPSASATPPPASTPSSEKAQAAAKQAPPSSLQPTTPSEPPPPFVTAFGKVVDPAGKAVAGATVYLREWSSFRAAMEPYNENPDDILATTQTDAVGAFRFERVATKPLFGKSLWDVVVVAKHHAMAWQHLPDARGSSPLTISLAPEAKITGQVTDSRGRPVRGAGLSVYLIEPLESERSFPGPEGIFMQRLEREPGYAPPEFGDPGKLDLGFSRLAPAAKSDADGWVTLASLPHEARLWLRVSHDDYRSHEIVVATSDEPQEDLKRSSYKDGKPHTESLKVYSRDFSVALGPPTPRLVGRITAADTKKPLAGASVSAWWDSGSGELNAMTDTDGRFVFKETGGPRYRLQAFAAPGSDYVGRLLLVDVPQAKREVRVDVELARGETISGLVVDEGGKGVPGVGIAFDTGIEFFKATAVGPLAVGATTDGQGRFRVVVPPGKGKLRAFKGAGRSMEYDLPLYPIPLKSDRPEYTKEIEVVAGKPIHDVKFAVRHETPEMEAIRLGRTRTVEGMVTDPEGKPVAGAEVALVSSERDPNWHGATVLTDKSGRFSLTTTKFFNCEVIAAVDKERKLRGHSALPDWRDINAGKTPIEIRLLPTGTITGRVLEGNKPIAGLLVLLDGYTQGTMDRGKTDEHGRFRFIVEGGQVRIVWIHAPGYTDIGAPESQVAAGQTLELEPFSTLRADQSVSGIVVTPDGKPMAGVHMIAQAPSLSLHWRGADSFPTRKNGRFSISGLPNVPLTLTAWIRSPKDAKEPTRSCVTVAAQPGQTNVRIVFDPRLARVEKDMSGARK